MRRALVIALSVSLLSSLGHAQNASFNGLASAQILNPSVVTVGTGCMSGGTTWSYSVAAVDASGNSTGSTSAMTSFGCATLSASNYNLITVTAPVGAITCNVYRTAGGSGALIGRIANIPCGALTPAMYLDTVNTRIDSSSPPSNNGTGGLAAVGSVTGLNFLSNGTGAGTSDWVQGMPLTLCTQGGGSTLTQPQPCIQSNSFFLQAYNSITTAFGWTAPAATNPNNGPVIAAGGTGTPPTSALSVGYLTDTTLNPLTLPTPQPTLATVTGSLTINHLVSIANPSSGLYDFVDSGIDFSTGRIPYADETIPTFDSQSGVGLSQPTGNGVFSYPVGTGLSLTGMSPSSAVSAGTLFTLTGVAGGPCGTASCTAGTGQAISAGTGNGGGVVSGGTSGTGGAGGVLTLTTGSGGSSSAANANGGAGGSVVLMTGGGGTGGATTGAGGSGGAITVTTGNGANSIGAFANSSGGNVTFTLGKAGTGGTGSAGSTGAFQITGQQPSSNPSGNGFAVGTLLNVIGVPGGQTTFSGSNGGTGSVVSINSGAGGSATTGTGGTGSVISISSGPGGAATTGTGGGGGAVNITAGTGGAANTGGINGSGGNIFLTAGSAGSGSGGTGGSAGIIQAQSNVQVPAGTATAPALQFSSSSNGFYLPSGTGPTYESGGTPTVTFFNTTTGGLAVGGSGTYSMTSGTSIGTVDTGISRDSADAIDIGNGSPMDKSGTMNLTTLSATGNVTASSLLASSSGVVKWSTDTGLSRIASGVIAVGNGGSGDASGTVKAAAYATNVNCASASSPASCSSAASGSVAVPTGTGNETLVVDTTALTANSIIFVESDTSLGTKLGITCNTSPSLPYISARTAGTSFTISVSAAISTNRSCMSYLVIN